MKFSQMTPEQLGSYIGANVEIMREGSFLNKELIPWLKNEQDKLARTNNWRPNQNGVPPDLMKIGANVVWNSGIIEGLRILIDKLDEIKRFADEAGKEVKRRQDKEEKEKK